MKKKKTQKNNKPEIQNVQELMSIQVRGLDSVCMVAAHPVLGWAQTLNSFLRQVQRFPGLELGSKLLPRITYIYIFSPCPPRPWLFCSWLMKIEWTSKGIFYIKTMCIRPYIKPEKKKVLCMFCNNDLNFRANSLDVTGWCCLLLHVTMRNEWLSCYVFSVLMYHNSWFQTLFPEATNLAE